MADAIKFAHESIKIQIEAQERLANAVGRKEVREYETSEENEELSKTIHDACYDKCYAIAKKGTSKAERSLAFSSLKEDVKALFSVEEIEENGKLIGKYFSKSQKEAIRAVSYTHLTLPTIYSV